MGEKLSLRKPAKSSFQNHESHPFPESTSLKLDDNSQVAVIGSGPAGSFFTYL